MRQTLRQTVYPVETNGRTVSDITHVDTVDLLSVIAIQTINNCARKCLNYLNLIALIFRPGRSRDSGGK